MTYSSTFFQARQTKAPGALSGSSRSFNVVSENPDAQAAELTNVGSFEKCWKNVDGKWWLYKTASH
ncbi:MAG: hypothetical protein J5592_06400, partial [Clostridia bacterium]|nr:hypothetical protein [Clostridia bacterium]